jgi:hypothetical protein
MASKNSGKLSLTGNSAEPKGQGDILESWDWKSFDYTSSLLLNIRGSDLSCNSMKLMKYHLWN